LSLNNNIINNAINNDNDVLDDDILKEYQMDKINENFNSIDDYFWRYNQSSKLLINDDLVYSDNNENKQEQKQDINDNNDINDINNKIKNVLEIIKDTDDIFDKDKII
jgi:hypothetical protein